MTLALASACPAFAKDTVHRWPSDGTHVAVQAQRAPSVDALSEDPAKRSQDLEPGEYMWTPEASPAGPIVVVVSLPEQRAHVYRNGTRIGVSTISSGKAGHETPTGVFPILQKREEHYSNLYGNAPMPYMQRLTWDGIALHAGRIPGYPASHGCIRLPKAFAKKLFDATERGVTVVVADETSHGPSVVWPAEAVPVDAYTGLELGKAQEVATSNNEVHGGNAMATLE
jgi:lipoprotein-anchoring transpeptidase ErfK/SrfK